MDASHADPRLECWVSSDKKDALFAVHLFADYDIFLSTLASLEIVPRAKIDFGEDAMHLLQGIFQYDHHMTLDLKAQLEEVIEEIIRYGETVVEYRGKDIPASGPVDPPSWEEFCALDEVRKNTEAMRCISFLNVTNDIAPTRRWIDALLKDVWAYVRGPNADYFG